MPGGGVDRHGRFCRGRELGFLSCEPLLATLGEVDLAGIGWVIAETKGAGLTGRYLRTMPAGPGRHGARTARTAAARQRSGDIRARAKDQGIAVSDRGRIPASVTEQYQAAAKGRQPDHET